MRKIKRYIECSLATAEEIGALIDIKGSYLEMIFQLLKLNDKTFISLGVSQLSDGTPVLMVRERGRGARNEVKGLYVEGKLTIVVMEKSQGKARKH